MDVVKFIGVFLSLFALQTLHGQEMRPATQSLASFADRFSSFSKDYPQEKVYLHFDNTAYYQGETIWFKAYVVRADRNSLSEMSKILYVDFISAEGYIQETQKLKIENGTCNGSIKLSTSNYPGFYEVRAYTRYMLNFGDENYFSRVFPIYDKPETDGQYTSAMSKRPFSQRIPQVRPEYKQKGSLALNFYPEGGKLVAGVSSTVAFKATGKEGEDAVVAGEVYNAKGEKVAEFNSEYQGMGKFELLPDSGKYTAKAQCNGKEYKFELPEVQPAGYVLQIDNGSEEALGIQIKPGPRSPAKTLGISISSRGIMYGFEQVDISQNLPANLSFPKKMLPSGVSQITLFDQQGQALCERLVFVNHNSQMSIRMTQDKPTYQPFENINMQFQLEDKRGNPVETSFSLAVRDATTSSTNPYGDNILTNLLLSSELKGYIEHPEYYFEKDDVSRRQALDLLMMVQGWVRYDWDTMTGRKPFKAKQPTEQELVMEGSVLSLFLGKKMPNVDLTMVLISDSLSQHGTCQTDSAGNFNFALQDFTGEAKLILQSKKKEKRKEMQIRLDRNFSPPFRPYSFSEWHAPQYFKTMPDSVLALDSLDNEQAFIDSLFANNKKLPMDKRNNLLKEVVVKAKRMPVKVSVKYEVAKEMDKFRDKGEWEPATIYSFLDKMNKYFIYVTNPNGSIGYKYKSKTVMFIRDDSRLMAGDALTEMNGENSESNNPNGNSASDRKYAFDQPFPYMTEIEFVTIVEDYNSIFRIYGGSINPALTVLAIIHCKKNYRKEPIGIRNTYFQGFAPQRQFYNPNYEHAPLPYEKDYRRTLYWNPDVKTDASGKATVSFYNNATCRLMNVSAETVTANGVMGAMEK